MPAPIRASKDEIADSKTAIKATGSSIGLAIFSVINKTMNNDEKKFGNEQVHYCVRGSTKKNLTKNGKTKGQTFQSQKTKNNVK